MRLNFSIKKLTCLVTQTFSVATVVGAADDEPGRFEVDKDVTGGGDGDRFVVPTVHGRPEGSGQTQRRHQAGFNIFTIFFCC